MTLHPYRELTFFGKALVLAAMGHHIPMTGASAGNFQVPFAVEPP
jgi:hypothetical protein